ncbi:MAG TPA: alpha/beta fold hydrolase [Ktedonobacterales bacterium]|nr:alpha/beta fold hydrolase [Ktedonobacterales bacterium]
MSVTLTTEHEEASPALAAAEEALLATAGIPIERHETRLNGVRIHYLTCGEGEESLVLVHGRGGAAALFTPILGALAAGRRVIALDLPGWGLSEKPPFTGHTASDAVAVWRDALLAFLDDQGLTQTDLAGHSMGGLTALALALDAPERVRRLALIDSGGLGGEPSFDIRLYFRLKPERLNPRLGPRFFAWAHSRDDAQPISKRGPLSDFMYAVESQTAVIPSGGRAFDKWVNLGGVHLDFRSRLRELEMPVLLLWGDRDRLFPYSTALQATRQIPTGRLVAFTHCGHSPHQERPADFARTLAAWLDGYRVPSRV